MNLEASLFNGGLAIVFIIAAFMLTSIKSSESWLKTEGKITVLSADKNFNRDNASNLESVEYKVDLAYEFNVSGKVIQGENIYAGFPNVFSDQKEMLSFIDEYENKSYIDVFYDNENPEKSALKKPGVSGSGYAVLWALLITVTLIIYAVINKVIFVK